MRWPIWAAGVPEVPCEVPACAASKCHLLMAEAPPCQSCPPISFQDGGQHQAHTKPSSPASLGPPGWLPSTCKPPPAPPLAPVSRGTHSAHVLPGGGCQPLPCGCPWRSGASRGHFLPCPWICHRVLSHPQNAEVPRREGDTGFGEGLGPDLSRLRLLGCEEPAHSSGGSRGCWKWRQWVTTVPGRQGGQMPDCCRVQGSGCRVCLPEELVPPNTAPAGASAEPGASQEGVLQPGL